MNSLIANLKNLSEHNRDSTMDLLYDTIDDMFGNGEFEKVDSIFELAISQDLSNVDALLGILTATFPGKQKLYNRNDFFLFVESKIGSDLLKGLK